MSSTEGASESKHGDSSGVALLVSEPQEAADKSVDRDVTVAEESSREKKHKKKVLSCHFVLPLAYDFYFFLSF
jgi:hypothetical protein